jgi:hypothetical protein
VVTGDVIFPQSYLAKKKKNPTSIEPVNKNVFHTRLYAFSITRAIYSSIKCLLFPLQEVHKIEKVPHTKLERSFIQVF